MDIKGLFKNYITHFEEFLTPDPCKASMYFALGPCPLSLRYIIHGWSLRRWNYLIIWQLSDWGSNGYCISSFVTMVLQCSFKRNHKTWPPSSVQTINLCNVPSTVLCLNILDPFFCFDWKHKKLLIMFWDFYAFYKQFIEIAVWDWLAYYNRFWKN